MLWSRLIHVHVYRTTSNQMCVIMRIINISDISESLFISARNNFNLALILWQFRITMLNLLWLFCSVSNKLLSFEYMKWSSNSVLFFSSRFINPIEWVNEVSSVRSVLCLHLFVLAIIIQNYTTYYKYNHYGYQQQSQRIYMSMGPDVMGMI